MNAASCIEKILEAASYETAAVRPPTFCCIAVIHIQPYTYTRGNIVNTIMMNETQFFRKIYLSLYLKGLRKGYVWEVSWRLNKTATYWPQVPPSLAALPSRSARLLTRRTWGPSSLLGLVLTASNCYKLTPTNWTSCRTIVWRPPASCERHMCTEFNPSTVKVIA